jgi:GNAT superfamily N-acetyltransferase
MEIEEQYIFREATVADIRQMQIVRHSVKENVLSNPDLVTDKDCEEYITLRGKGWVCEIENTIVGFAIADLLEHNIWALFVMPEYEKRGIGKKMHNIMLHWYFSQTDETVWLSTASGTRAEKFYRTCGWIEVGITKTDEIKFELSFKQWKNKFGI